MTTVIWVKTDAGRDEIQTRARLKDRSLRTLLLLIDGTKSEEMLLAHLAGVKRDDFQHLRALDLIAPAAGAVKLGGGPAGAPGARGDARPAAPPPTERTPLDYGSFTAGLTKLISTHLGLRGFNLTLAVEKAGTIEELRDVAERVLAQIRERKGDDIADQARRSLFGG